MLEAFFNPKSVAIIGASADTHKIGHVVLSNVIKGGFKGDIYPINPHETEILGLKVYKTIGEVSESIDLAVVVIPPKYVNAVLEECGQKGIKGVIIITAGFKEASKEGAVLEDEMKKIAEKFNITILGPNCFGLIDSVIKLNTSFSGNQMLDGNIALISQSGAFCASILDWAESEQMGFSRFLSLGNEVNLSEVELLQFLADDENTKVIMAYLEQIVDGKRFLEVTREVSKKKPIIILKSGVSASGQKAASSHTGSLASSDEAVNAAFKQAGIIRAKTMEEMFDLAEAFAHQPFPTEGGVAVVSNAGGPAVVATDAIELAGLQMAKFSTESVAKLKEKVPPTSHCQNPLDLIGDAYSDRFDWALEVLNKDPSIKSFIILVIPQELTDVENIAKVIEKHKLANPDKPYLVSLMGGEAVEAGKIYLEKKGIPTYHFPEEAVRALKALYNYGQFLERSKNNIAEKQDTDIDTKALELGKSIINKSKDQKLKFIPEADAKELLSAYGLSFPKLQLAQSAEEAVSAANKIGYPIVLKIVSTDITHKTDVGGVALDLNTEQEVKEAYQKIIQDVKTNKPKASIDGVAVAEMIDNGKEIIVGVKKDSSFGHMIMVGLGGIYVEILKDVSFRLAPLTSYDTERMLKDLRSYSLLTGVRGENPADIEALQKVILQISKLVTDFPEIETLDLNPLFVLDKGNGVKVVDQVIGI